MSTQSDIPSSDSQPLEQTQYFSSLQAKHTRRQMRQFVVAEAELDQISLLNTATNWLFSAASGAFLFALGLAVNGIIEGNLTEKGMALLQFGIPSGVLLSIIFTGVGILSWWKRRSILNNLKQQSEDIDQISLVTNAQLTQFPPSTPDNEGSQT